MGCESRGLRMLAKWWFPAVVRQAMECSIDGCGKSRCSQKFGGCQEVCKWHYQAVGGQAERCKRQC